MLFNCYSNKIERKSSNIKCFIGTNIQIMFKVKINENELKNLCTINNKINGTVLLNIFLLAHFEAILYISRSEFNCPYNNITIVIMCI